MSEHVTISPTEAADRRAIRVLVQAYAYCAGRRDAKGQNRRVHEMSLVGAGMEIQGRGARL